MKLSDSSIKRPVVAIVASLLLVVFGLYSLTQLPVRETPDIDRPTVSVSVAYPGAAAEVVESTTSTPPPTTFATRSAASRRVCPKKPIRR